MKAVRRFVNKPARYTHARQREALVFVASTKYVRTLTVTERKGCRGAINLYRKRSNNLFLTSSGCSRQEGKEIRRLVCVNAAGYQVMVA